MHVLPASTSGSNTGPRSPSRHGEEFQKPDCNDRVGIDRCESIAREYAGTTGGDKLSGSAAEPGERQIEQDRSTGLVCRENKALIVLSDIVTSEVIESGRGRDITPCVGTNSLSVSTDVETSVGNHSNSGWTATDPGSAASAGELPLEYVVSDLSVPERWNGHAVDECAEDKLPGLNKPIIAVGRWRGRNDKLTTPAPPEPPVE